MGLATLLRDPWFLLNSLVLLSYLWIRNTFSDDSDLFSQDLAGMTRVRARATRLRHIRAVGGH